MIVLDDIANLSTRRPALFLPFFFPHPVLPPPPPSDPRCLSTLSRRTSSSAFLRFWRARVCVCVGAIMAVSVWEGGRQTFKSTPPQSNYRPGHETRCPCIIYGSCRVPHTISQAISCTLGHGGRKGREGRHMTEKSPGR